MDTTRFILVMSLVLTGMLLWDAWQQDYVRPTTTAPASAPADPAAAAGADSTPSSAEIPAGIPDEPSPDAAAPPAPAARPAGERITVQTDVLSLHIATRGAQIRHAELLEYPVARDRPDEALVLMDDTGPELYVAQGGLLSSGPAPTHQDTYTARRFHYELEAGSDSLVVPLTWESDGVRVTKTFTLARGSYLVRIDYRVENTTGAPWQGRLYSQIQRTDPGRAGRRLLYTYTGAVYSSPDQRYDKVDFDDMRDQKVERDVSNGWVAMLEHYFVTALIPVEQDRPYRYYSLALPEDRFAVGAVGPGHTVQPGSSGRLSGLLYIGPKLQHVLEDIAEGLDLTVDYGMLWFIAKPLFWCLEWFHGFTGNWGWAIVLVTVLLKLIFYPLSAAGYRSMANMRRVQPRIMAIRDRHKDDRARLNQAMMQIYKEEKINPFGGCLPILVQIPVFIALYWVLLESVEMRQAEFILWLNDLSTPDPYWVLPIVMGVTMFIQQKLNPAPMDPVQEKVMQIMPFAFTIFFGFFPSGLVLYWVVNNILSIAQQWLITRNLERATGAPQKK